MDAGRGNLFVFAAGNEGVTAPLASIQQSQGGHLALMVATARVFGARPGHVLIVGGTDTTGALWVDSVGGSSFWVGATDIVAPATAMRIPVRAAGDFPEGALVSGGGTSLSAPLVGGVAGLLLAMDSTLTAAQVKDYILRGAREPKGWSAPDVTIPVTPVAGAPETVYQLDAYGALTLLSRERPNTPFCGFPVGLSPDGREVVLRRNQEQRLAISLPEGASLSAISVAQGGRRLALQRRDAQGTTAVLETDYRGESVRPIPGVDRRWYLETDTADVLIDAERQATVILRGAGDPVTIPITARVPIRSSWSVDQVIVAPAPDGSWFAAFHQLLDPPPEFRPPPDLPHGPNQEFRWDLVPRDRDAAAVSVYARYLKDEGVPCLFEGGFCDTGSARADWNPSARRLWLAVGQFQMGGKFRTLAFNLPLVE